MKYSRSVGSLKDFVSGNFPQPYNPIYNKLAPNWDQNPGISGLGSMGLEDFVDANFPEPYNPIWQNPAGASGKGGIGGCGCSDCGMGAIAVPTWAASFPAPLNGVDPVFSVPWVYWGLGVGAAVIVLPMISGKKGRR